MRCKSLPISYLVVVKDKVDVSGSLGIVLDEVFVALRTFLLRITREHALQTDADALYIVYGTPA